MAEHPDCWQNAEQHPDGRDLAIEVAQAQLPDVSVVIVNPYRGLYHSEIVIDAPADLVWATLTDFDDMSWSPGFRGLTGDIVDGGHVQTHFGGSGDGATPHRRGRLTETSPP